MASFVSLQEAVAANTRDGDIVALEGFTHLIPYAAGHELIRQQRRGLTLVRMTPDIIYDQLIGMGAAAKLIFSWGGNPGVGPSPPSAAISAPISPRSIPRSNP
jgi:glutaconate CoA-transferase subunit A